MKCKNCGKERDIGDEQGFRDNCDHEWVLFGGDLCPLCTIMEDGGITQAEIDVITEETVFRDDEELRAYEGKPNVES